MKPREWYQAEIRWAVMEEGKRGLREWEDAVYFFLSETGAFKDVQVHEVLTQEQLRDVVTLAKSSEAFYHAPGASAVERELSVN